ncbi:MAG: FG-GAP-like repeat-containing protein, partial [Burkholderiales bacterium]
TYNGAADTLLGNATLPVSLTAGASAVLTIPVTGKLPFRDAPIHLWIDSRQAVTELGEDNNLGSSAAAYEIKPSVGELQPQLKWYWQSSPNFPGVKQVESGIVVVQVNDDNGDGKTDENDNPDVAFIAYDGSVSEGVLRVVSGRDGTEILSLKAPGGVRLSGWPGFAAADIDRDGKVEFLISTMTGQLAAISHTGALKWVSNVSPAYSAQPYGGGASIADLDGDGSPEILFGRHVLRANGSLWWQGSGTFTGAKVGMNSIAADLDLDGSPEVIVGASAYSAQGTLRWQNSTVGNGYAAVGNFNSDPYPEIVVVAGGARVFMLNRLGTIIWGPVSVPGGGEGGAPTIADMDGDGVPEIGVAAGVRYAVFRAGGSIAWTAVINDSSSSQTGSTVFDFDGDGRAEVVFADQTLARIFDGRTGAILHTIPHSSATAGEHPVVADIDGDGHAELLIASSTLFGGIYAGVRAFQSVNNTWTSARPMWNQYAYHVTNVNEDGSIPLVEQNSWQAHNTYRANVGKPMYSCVAPIALLTEDFNDGGADGWLPLAGSGSTPGSVSNGEYVRSGSGASYVGDTAWTDYTVKIRMRFPSGATNSAGLVLRARSASEWYSVRIKTGQIQLVKSASGSIQVVQQASVSLSTDPQFWHALNLEVVGNTLRAYLNGKLSIDYTGLAWSNGAVGTEQDAVLAHYDDLSVATYAPPYAHDATASYLRVQDGGLGQVSAFTVRVGNAGNLDLSNGMRVGFYSGDPGAGGVMLGSALTTTRIRSGQFEDVVLSYTADIAALSELVAVVDDLAKISECDETNNRVSLGLATVPGVFNLQVSTDQPTYGANTDVIVAGVVSNVGSLDRNATLRFSIETADGLENVQALNTVTVGAIPRSASQSVPAVWNTGDTFAGAYRVRAELAGADGNPL